MLKGWPLKVSCGYGVNSVAMLVGLRLIDAVPEAILFADTGSEMPGTYDYMPILQDWCVRVGFPEIITVKNPSPIAGDASLYDSCVRLGILPSISYGFQRHNCAIKWKLTPQQRWCRSWPLARVSWAEGGKVWDAVGFDDSPGDCKRYAKANDRKPDPLYQVWYPLRQWGWDRAQCVRAIESVGLEVPPKSSCFMCASRTKPEILAMARDDPATMLRALHLERKALPGLTKVKGLGSKFSWDQYLKSEGIEL